MDIIIETPRGSREKFTYDKKLGLFRLKKVLAHGLEFPFDFGFIPGTKGEDGDPLDVMILSELDLFTGCVLDCRIIGCLTALQKSGEKEISNDRFLAVPLITQQYEDILSIEDLQAQLLADIENFFLNYTRSEGKEFRLTGRLSAAKAVELLPG